MPLATQRHRHLISSMYRLKKLIVLVKYDRARRWNLLNLFVSAEDQVHRKLWDSESCMLHTHTWSVLMHHALNGEALAEGPTQLTNVMGI